MLSREEILARVKQVLTTVFEVDPDSVALDAELYADLDLDSLDAIDLAVKLDSETGIKLSEQEMKSIRTVADVVDTIFHNLERQQSL